MGAQGGRRGTQPGPVRGPFTAPPGPGTGSIAALPVTLTLALGASVEQGLLGLLLGRMRGVVGARRGGQGSCRGWQGGGCLGLVGGPSRVVVAMQGVCRGSTHRHPGVRAAGMAG